MTCTCSPLGAVPIAYCAEHAIPFGGHGRASAESIGDEDARAQSAYHAYGRSTEFKNYRGDPMPAWQALPVAIQRAWAEAVRAVSKPRAWLVKRESAEPLSAQAGVTYFWTGRGFSSLIDDALRFSREEDAHVAIADNVPQSHRRLCSAEEYLWIG